MFVSKILYIAGFLCCGGGIIFGFLQQDTNTLMIGALCGLVSFTSKFTHKFAVKNLLFELDEGRLRDIGDERIANIKFAKFGIRDDKRR